MIIETGKDIMTFLCTKVTEKFAALFACLLQLKGRLSSKSLLVDCNELKQTDRKKSTISTIYTPE